MMALKGVNINVDVESLKQQMLSNKAPKSKTDIVHSSAPINKTVLNDQKALNEQKANALRKKLIDRQMKLKKEQQDLKELDDEFRSMEDKLSKDVETLRNLIEGINKDITYHQPDLDYKKQQYEQSKHQMQKMCDRREQLTKHLHVIIQSNEQLKADKMQKMMNKLQKIEVQSNKNNDALNPFGGFDDSHE